MGIIEAGKLDRRIRFERPVRDDSFDGAGSGTWEEVITVWAQVQDVRPSRGERVADVVNLGSRPAKIVIRWRPGITADMRIVHGDRVMQIVSGPAELGRREALEMMCEEYSTAGNPA
jgi:SPP1 family predicted phage head-tail adaptor